MKRRDLEKEIQAAFDGEPVDERALRDALLEDPAALDAWCDYALLDAELRRHAHGRLKIPGTVPAAEEVKRRTRRRRIAMASWMSAAAVVVLSAALLGMFWISQQETVGRVAVSKGSILTGGEGSEPGTLAKDRPLTLAQGVAELELPSGVRAIIEGPATFRLVGENRLHLAGGHSWFLVPDGAEGFMVETPRCEVVDLGTEFGIDLREDHPVSVHVLDGKVEARALTGRSEVLPLSAGQAAVLGPAGTWKRLPVVSRDFRTSLPPEIPVFHLSFDWHDGGMLAVEGDALGASRARLGMKGTGRVQAIPGVSGQALQFDGGTWIESDWPGISGTAPRTVSLWCRLPAGERIETAPPFALWGNPATGWNRKFKVAPATLADGRTVLRASFGNYLANGSRVIADGTWHHLAVVYRGNDPAGKPLLEFFVDGTPDPLISTGESAGILTDTERGTVPGLSIGRYELPAQGRDPFLAGAIDELRVHAGALDAEAILALSRER
jgi:ferric-dicitrate binding protein FerR (iron transport regulator)